MRAGEPVRAADPPSSRLLHARLTGEVDASSCEESVVRQSLAGMVVGEKNRCIQIVSVRFLAML